VQVKDPRYSAGEVKAGNDWPAIAVQIAVATVFSGVIAYVATNPQELVQAAAQSHLDAPVPAPAPAVVVPPAVQDEPVQVKNPFDPSEVFQFPAGTSDTEARLAVAKLLIQRAQDRRDLWTQAGHRARKRANHVPPEANSTELARAGVASSRAKVSVGLPQS